MADRHVKPTKIIFRYMPVRSVHVGKTLLVKSRGEGTVKGILLTSYKYLTTDGDKARIEDIFRVCLQFQDEQNGVCLSPFKPTDYFYVSGWGTYLPGYSKEMPWRELR